jgi:hypothetical protein
MRSGAIKRMRRQRQHFDFVRMLNKSFARRESVALRGNGTMLADCISENYTVFARDNIS